MKLQINKIVTNPIYFNFIGKCFRYVLAKFQDGSSGYYTDNSVEMKFLPSYDVTPRVCVKMLKLSGVEYDITG